MKRRYHPDRMDAVEIAEYQMEYEGKYDEINKFLAKLSAAIDQGAIPVEEKQSAGEHVYQYIRRHDYVEWRKRMGLSPPDWWLVEGDTEQYSAETPSRRGRNTNPKALINRPEELKADAIAIAREIGDNPTVEMVARFLKKKEKYQDWKKETIQTRIRKHWWKQPTK